MAKPDICKCLANWACVSTNEVHFSPSVKLWTTWARQRGAGRHLAVGLMLSLWIAVLALAASPQLHRLLHQDGNDLGHHCLISQLKQHLLLAGLAPAVTAVAPAGAA